MKAESDSSPLKDDNRICLLGGIAVMVAIAIHIIVNEFIKTMPPFDLTADELNIYLDQETSNWAIVHGLRYIAFSCATLFSAGLFIKIYRNSKTSSYGWEILALLGTAIAVTSGMMTNGIETLSYLNIDLLKRNQDLFWLLRSITGTLFTAEFVPWSLVILGFSVAGFQSSALPKWLVIPGFLIAASGILVGLFISNILTGGWASIFLTITSIGIMAWNLCAGILMILDGWKQIG